MKKGIFLFSLVSSITLGAVQSFAAQSSNKANFEIVNDENGTLLIEASDLAFGSHTISASDIYAKALSDSNIKITEYSGLKPGWSLSVELGKFTDQTSQSTIDGVRMFYPTVEPSTSTTGAEQNAPTTSNNNTSFMNELQTGVTVNDTGASVKIASAAVGNGYGVWTLPYSGDNRIQLNIPSGQRVGSYQSTLTYTVTEGP